MVNTYLEILKFIKAVRLDIPSLLSKGHVLLKLLSYLVTKILLDDVWKRIWKLKLGHAHFPDEHGTTHDNLVDVVENVLFEAFINERLDIKLQV